MMRAHSAPWGGKRCARDGASQVVVGIAVAARKMGTGEAKDGLNLNSGLAQREQVSGDPRSTMLPSGCAKRSRICHRCTQFR